MLNLFFSTGKLMLTTFSVVSLTITSHRSMVHTVEEEILHPSTFLTALFISIAVVGVYTGCQLRVLCWWSPLALIFLAMALFAALGLTSPLFHYFIVYTFFILVGLVMSKYLYPQKTNK